MATQAPASPPASLTKLVLEDSAWCGGTGYSAGDTCEGNGKLLVAAPSIKCPRCVGDGRATDRTMYSYTLCVVCCGTGWALVMRK